MPIVAATAVAVGTPTALGPAAILPILAMGRARASLFTAVVTVIGPLHAGPLTTSPRHAAGSAFIKLVTAPGPDTTLPVAVTLVRVAVGVGIY